MLKLTFALLVAAAICGLAGSADFAGLGPILIPSMLALVVLALITFVMSVYKQRPSRS